MKKPTNIHDSLPTCFNKKKWLPYSLVTKAFKEGWDDSLIVFLRLKQVYQTPIFYNYTKRGLAQLLGYSYNGLRPHLDKLEREGLVYTHNNNLCLLGVKKLQAKYQSSFLVPIRYEENKQDHLDCLRFVVIKRKLDLQVSQTNKLVEIIKMQENLGSFTLKDTKRIYKRYKKLEKDNPSSSIEKLTQCGPTLSNETIGLLINRSSQVGIKTQQNLNRLGLIKSFQRIELTNEQLSKQAFAIKKNSNIDDSSLRGKNGKTFYQHSNIIFTSGMVLKNNKGEEDYELTIKNLFKRSDFYLLVSLHMNEKKNLIVTRARTDKSSSKLSWNSKQSRLRSFIRESYLPSNISQERFPQLKEKPLTKWKKAELTIYNRYNNDPSCAYYKDIKALNYILNKRESIIKGFLKKD